MLTTVEVCTLLGVSKMAISRWTKAGTIPFFRVGTILRFDPGALAAWAQDRMN